jgi:hypothetical protein
MMSSQPLLTNSGLTAILALGELLLPPCGPRPSLGFIQVCLMLHWGGSWLVMAPDNCFSFPPTHLIPLLPETVTQDWKFRCCKCSSTSQWEWPRSTCDH